MSLSASGNESETVSMVYPFYLQRFHDPKFRIWPVTIV
jgi:hypothetical protein